jgi:4-hydroxybenzoate polyprenyltransferase
LKKIKNYLRLVRPANIVTSIADVLAGIAISGFFMDWYPDQGKWLSVLFLCLSTAGLYGGGIVFNDIFDAELDKKERPERPIPSGAVALKEAVVLGVILFVSGILLAGFVSMVSALLALSIACFALLYDKYSKHHSFWGPLNMGVCRGLNLLLGVSIIPSALQTWYFIAAVPIMYIFSITMISQGEVHGGGRKKLYLASLLYIIVAGIILYVSFIKKEIVWTLLFILPFAWMIFKPLARAIKEPVGKNIGRAVKAGVIGLILMDAAWAASFHSFYAAVFIAALLPLSIWLAKRFAVT